MYYLDAAAQEKIDARVHRHTELADDAFHELKRCSWDRGGLNLNRLEPENVAMMRGQTRLEQILKTDAAQELAPNPWAVRQVARMFCEDSAKARTRGWRADAGEARLFALMLQHVVAAAVPTLYEREQARMLFPIDTSIPAGAETVLKHRVIDEDFAPALGDYGQLSPRGDDIPMVDVSGTSDIYQLASFARGITWTVPELEAAAFAGIPLKTEKLAALNRAVRRIFELVAMIGYPSANITGAYNDANPAVTVPTTGTWATATAVQIIADVHDLMQAVRLATGYNYMPNRLIIPSSLSEFLSLRNVAMQGNVRSMIQEDFPGVQIMECDRANLYDVAGTGPRIMALTYDPQIMNIMVPREFQFEPPEKHALQYRLFGYQTLGGCVMSTPLAVGYMDGC